ncbi:MAG TPA: hypothetical protein VLG49_00340 [Rhabdochlamydiaceae bacterium]|nr:hypothetical protein [Rhabdochlamydiaceae bacterium]
MKSVLKKSLICFLLIFSNLLIAREGRRDREGKVDAWEMTEYVWNLGMAASCDIGPEKNPRAFFAHFAPDNALDENKYKAIKRGDIIWIQCRFIDAFNKHVLPYVEHPFVLVINDGDESFPSDCGNDFNIEEFLRNDKIIHVFAQNNDYCGNSSKVSHIPIGMDFHTIAYKGVSGGWGERGSPKQQEEVLKNLLKKFPPTYDRKLRAFVDFQLSDTMRAGHKRYLQFGEDRTTIFQRLLPTGLIDYSGFMKRSTLWETKGHYAFSICPFGNGLDTHRVWEDLVLGCIAIVKSSTLDPMFEGLPVVIVQDWSEITQSNLEKWVKEYGDAFTNPLYREKLTNQYWLEKIHSMAYPYKTSG